MIGLVVSYGHDTWRLAREAIRTSSCPINPHRLSIFESVLSHDQLQQLGPAPPHTLPSFPYMLPRLRRTAQHFRPITITTSLRATTGSAMSTFTLPDSHPEVPVHLTSDLNKDQLLSFTAFKTWISTLKRSLALQNIDSHPFHSSPYHLRKIDIQSVDFFGGRRIGFVKLKAEVSNDNGESLPGSVFLRGGSVGMMVR